MIILKNYFRLQDLLGGGSSIDAIASNDKMKLDEEFDKALGEFPLVNKYFKLLKPKGTRKRRKKGKRNRKRKRKGSRQKNPKQGINQESEANQHKPQLGSK